MGTKLYTKIVGILEELPMGKGKSVDKDSVYDALDYVRASIKYLLFDLEATKRELKAAKKRGK